MAYNALLLCCTANWSSVLPLAGPWHGCVFLATVVWVTSNQAWLAMPDAIETLMDMAKARQDGVALCYIPVSKPFFPYPDDGPHVLILPFDHDMPVSQGYGMPVDFSAFEATSYTIGASTAVGLTARLTSSLPTVIPSTSTAGTQPVGPPPGGPPPIGPPPGFPAFHEDPIQCQAAIREQITADAKTLAAASLMLCTDFRHIGNYYSKQWKAMRECQLQGIHGLKTTVQKALSDWMVDLNSQQ